jgi:cytidylate kinase
MQPDITRFLEALSRVEQIESLPHGGPRRALPFVTISRQAGAGGHTLADTLLKLMAQQEDTALFQGWQILDQQLCGILLQDDRLDVSMQSLLSEEYRSQVRDFVRGLLAQPDQHVAIRRMFEVIRSLASVGKVIIVGRAGSHVTKRLELGVHTRLVAPEYLRIRRMMKLLNQDEDEARRTVRRQDSDRARLLKSYFQVDIDDPLQYDVVWNTGGASFAVIANSIISLIKQRVQDWRLASGT